MRSFIQTRRGSRCAGIRAQMSRLLQVRLSRMKQATPHDALVRDVFVSHASEDKEAIARPLAEALRNCGLTIWFDEYELVLGDSLRRKVDEGLRYSRVGVVILSQSFFAKEWPQRELDGLTARRNAGEPHVVLPVWHGVELEDVLSYSPPLADVVAARSSDGVQGIAVAVAGVVSTLETTERTERVGTERATTRAEVRDGQRKKSYQLGMAGFQYVTFNAFVDVPNVGDESSFINGMIDGAPDGFYSPMRGLLDGNSLLFRMIVHNGADPSLNDSGTGIARGVRVRAGLPIACASHQTVSGAIEAENADPRRIASQMELTANESFWLEYESGSARLSGNRIDVPLSDDLIGVGVPIGDTEPMSGEVRACFNNVVLVLFRARVVFAS